MKDKQKILLEYLEDEEDTFEDVRYRNMENYS